MISKGTTSPIHDDDQLLARINLLLSYNNAAVLSYYLHIDGVDLGYYNLRQHMAHADRHLWDDCTGNGH